MSKKIAILQSNYIPWKGYFDIIQSVDLFVFHDDLQYTKNDWRNRNKIKTESGLEWLSIPCGKKENRLICEVQLKDNKWQKKHFEKIKQVYRYTPFLKDYIPFLEHTYIDTTWTNLSDLNQFIIKYIAFEFLGIKTKFMDSRDLNLKSKKQEKVLDILDALEATSYLSGPAGKAYLDESKFKALGIELEWMRYDNYPVYSQQYGHFHHDVTILDLLCHCGPSSKQFIKRD